MTSHEARSKKSRGEMGKRKAENSASVNRAEVKVTGSQGQTLPQIEHGGVTYVVSNPGETFEVSVRHWEHKTLQVNLAVDGKYVGYNISGSPGSWVVFDGFFQGPLTTRAFVFAKPDCTNNTPASSNVARPVASVGVLEVKFYEEVDYACLGATCWHCQFRGHVENTLFKPVIKSAESIAAEEGKKFFLSPSLSVATGDILTLVRGKRERIHRKPSGPILFSARVHCETAEALVLRKVLDPNNTEHAALLPERLRQLFTVNPMTRRAAPVTRKRAPQPLDMKPGLGETSAPATRNAQPGNVNAEDDEVLAVSTEKRPISVVDLDQMPELDDDCVILSATGPKKKKRNHHLQV